MLPITYVLFFIVALNFTHIEHCFRLPLCKVLVRVTMEVVARENTLFSITVGGSETSYSGAPMTAATALLAQSQSPCSTPPLPAPTMASIGHGALAGLVASAADASADGAHVLDFGDIYFDGVSQVERAVEIRNLSDLTLPFKLSAKLLHGWTAAMRASEVRYALSPGPHAEHIKHVVVPPRRRLRLFVSLLAVWRDDVPLASRTALSLSLSPTFLAF
jgi:hypothetical protein